MDPFETPKVELKKQRDFSGIFNATFAFIKQEFKPLIKPLLYYVAPVVLVLAIITSLSYSYSLKSMDMNNIGFGIFSAFSGSMLQLLILYLGAIVVNLYIYSYIKSYIDNGNQVNFEQVKEIMKNKFMAVLGWSILVGILIFIFTLLLIIPGIYFYIVSSLVIPVIIFDNKNGSPISRSTYLIKNYWWLTFGLIAIMGITISFIQSSLSMTLSMIVVIDSLHTLEDDSFEMLANMPFYYYIANAVIYTVSIILSSVLSVMLAFHYFNLVERKEMPDLMERIESIQPGESH